MVTSFYVYHQFYSKQRFGMPFCSVLKVKSFEPVQHFVAIIFRKMVDFHAIRHVESNVDE